MNAFLHTETDVYTSTSLNYLSGFGNEFASEAVAGSLPHGRNNPQKPPFGLYAEQLSGTAFTAPRSENRRTWLYRGRPSVVFGNHQPYAQDLWTGASPSAPLAPDPLRWNPFVIPDAPLDFVDGVRKIASCGDAAFQDGIAACVYLANKSMAARAFANSDAEMLFVPQQGRLRCQTELGILEAGPGEVMLVPRGMLFQIELPDGPSRGYLCENFGALFRLPELGPIGSNGLASARDFQVPVAAFSADGRQEPFEIIRKFRGQFWRTRSSQSPFDVVAWHGNLVPWKYDTAKFMAIGSISFDHPDPSIFTVVTSPSARPGTANCDFVIFPPRWMVAEDTFRPPWYHRNVMSEFMGLVHGRHDAKPSGFLPGGASIHNCMVPHGPDAEAFEKASNEVLAPQKVGATLAFMFEARYPLVPSAYAVECSERDLHYSESWQGLENLTSGHRTQALRA